MAADFRRCLNVLASSANPRRLLALLTIDVLANAVSSWLSPWGSLPALPYAIRTAGETVVVAVYIAVLVTCAATDLMSFRVPNVVTYPAALFAFLAAAFMPHGDLREALLGGALAAGFMLVVLVVSRGGMGLGDVKLSVFVGLALGWPLVGDSLFLMALAGGVAAVVLLATGLRSRKDPIPYAPFISGSGYRRDPLARYVLRPILALPPRNRLISRVRLTSRNLRNEVLSSPLLEKTTLAPNCDPFFYVVFSKVN